jgi:hypothetical protein
MGIHKKSTGVVKVIGTPPSPHIVVRFAYPLPPGIHMPIKVAPMNSWTFSIISRYYHHYFTTGFQEPFLVRVPRVMVNELTFDLQ